MYFLFRFFQPETPRASGVFGNFIQFLTAWKHLRRRSCRAAGRGILAGTLFTEKPNGLFFRSARQLCAVLAVVFMVFPARSFRRLVQGRVASGPAQSCMVRSLSRSPRATGSAITRAIMSKTSRPFCATRPMVAGLSSARLDRVYCTTLKCCRWIVRRCPRGAAHSGSFATALAGFVLSAVASLAFRH